MNKQRYYKAGEISDNVTEFIAAEWTDMVKGISASRGLINLLVRHFAYYGRDETGKIKFVFGAEGKIYVRTRIGRKIMKSLVDREAHYIDDVMSGVYRWKHSDGSWS